MSMTDVAPVQSTGPIVLTPPAAKTSAASAQPCDHLELSDVAMILARLAPQEPIRADKVAEIRAAIEDGTYETPEKLNYTMDRLAQIVRGQR
jgi:anti-sigma28 factor (negative regulator of flagellin synthesis)